MQSGGEGGRGGGYYTSSITSYCSDNVRDQRYPNPDDGQYQYCDFPNWAGCCNKGGSPGEAYDNYDDVSLLMFLPGSGGGAGAGLPGGAGGYGGAAILLYSTEMTLNGAVKANGGDGGSGSGAVQR